MILVMIFNLCYLNLCYEVNVIPEYKDKCAVVFNKSVQEITVSCQGLEPIIEKCRGCYLYDVLLEATVIRDKSIRDPHRSYLGYIQIGNPNAIQD